MDKAQALKKLMPPVPLKMTDYEEVGAKDCSWFNSPQAMDSYKAQITSNPGYQAISQNPAEHTELLETLIAEANGRMYLHMIPCCAAAIKPCKTSVISLFFFLHGYNASQRGESCALSCTLGCLGVLGTCGQCSKCLRTTRGITKTMEKTLAARKIFEELQKKIQ